MPIAPDGAGDFAANMTAMHLWFRKQILKMILN